MLYFAPLPPGESLAIPALEPEAVDPDRSIFCTTTAIRASFGEFFRRSVRKGDWVLMTDPPNNNELLFDTTKDRREHNNLLPGAEGEAGVAPLREELSRTLTGNIAKLKFF